ncbi:MAG: superoxide dismutase family protein [Prolixibacteraceae bacterium]|nr:superoxide dismutase family protein [Burkholderiales bacterium]
MNRSITLLVIGLGFSLLPGCASNKGSAIYEDPSAVAVLSPTQGSSVHGTVTFVRTSGVALVNVNMTGFKPNTSHGMHIHESGDCTARDASSAGEHFNPTSAEHGGPEKASRHSGDLGNVTADSKGEIYASFKVGEIAFGTGQDSIIGRGLVVHAGADDLTSQPAGNSGARVACGMITRNPDRMTYSKAGDS